MQTFTSLGDPLLLLTQDEVELAVLSVLPITRPGRYALASAIGRAAAEKAKVRRDSLIAAGLKPEAH